MILTVYFVDGTTTRYNRCPDWARWIEYDCFGKIFAWEKKPTQLLHDKNGYSPAQPNQSTFWKVGKLPRKQTKNLRLQLQKLELL